MTIKFVCRMLIVFLLLGNGGFMQGISEAASDECIQVVNAIQFSNDPDQLLFRYHCGGPNNPEFWAVYELSSGRVYDFTVLNKATKNAINDSPSYSRDGKLITFVAGQDNDRNIFVMNADGSNVRQLTHDYNESPKEVGKDIVKMRRNDAPSFSPDGRCIIFGRSGFKRQKPLYFRDPMYPTHWDVYEIEIETLKERRLTNYEFHSISQPYYLPDGKRFIFSAYLHTMEDSESGMDRKTRDKYWDKYKENTIFIMDGENNVMQPVLKNKRHSDEPQIVRDGLIVFRSDVTDIEGIVRTGTIYYDLFVYRNGSIERLANELYEVVRFTVSPDGTKVVFSFRIYGSPDVELSVINLDGTGRKEIRIPWRQLENQEINREGVRS
jgi:dipeptidyl aminopeptidase/acylaminoacyl peptidase